MKKTLALILAALILAACTSRIGPKAGSASSGGRLYQLTDSEKVGTGLRLTFATEWRAIQCNASINGLKVGSGQGNSLAGVAKVSINVPMKYENYPVGDFAIECSQF
jgi:hypothetical protein